MLSKNFENYIANNVIFTCVSEHDKKVKDTYNVKAQILANGIDYPNISKLKLLKRNSIIYFFVDLLNINLTKKHWKYW